MKLTGKGISVCKKVTNKNLVEMQNAIDAKSCPYAKILSS